MPLPRPQFFRLSTLLWLTLAVACFLGGMQFQQMQDDGSDRRMIRLMIQEAEMAEAKKRGDATP